MTDQEKDAVLRVLAEDAFDVLNWARRLGMKREAQLEQVVAAYRKTLTDSKTELEAA
jgi:hypothetical protein